MSPTPPCEFLAWDSDFFQCRIARVCGHDLAQDHAIRIDEWSRINNIECLYFLAGSENPRTICTAESHNFHLVDLRLTFAWSPDFLRPLNRQTAPADAVVRVAEPSDLTELQKLARKVHAGTRFFNDRHFPPDRVEELYSTWITLDCKGRSERVLVAASQTNQPLGYLSCMMGPDRRVGQIGLVAVSEAARGKGVGISLVLTACGWFAQQGIREIAVVTQGSNQPAQRLYQRCGFRLQDLKLWYHKWYC
jgi:ribosomal protein S18 acetylase RimI-like enzyme